MSLRTLLRAVSGPVLLAVLASGCAVTSSTSRVDTFATVTAKGPAAELRLGYFANLTHAPAVLGVGDGSYAAAVAPARLRTQVFTAGPAAVEALFAGSLDAAYLGPNPAINGFVRSAGEALRIVSGVASGGASLVVAPQVRSAAQLRGTVLASPQTGGTQDVALRTWLADQDLHVDAAGAGDVTIRSQDNSQTLQEFQAGRLAGAWVPEPWASRLVLEGGGRVLVDEKDLWPGGRFATTVLVVRTEFLREHPETVQALLQAQGVQQARLGTDRAGAAPELNARLEALTGKALQPPTLDRALSAVTFTADPLAATVRTSAAHAVATGLVEPADLTGIYDLTLLRHVLGRDVDDAGLGDPAGSALALLPAPSSSTPLKG